MATLRRINEKLWSNSVLDQFQDNVYYMRVTSSLLNGVKEGRWNRQTEPVFMDCLCPIECIEIVTEKPAKAGL